MPKPSPAPSVSPQVAAAVPNYEVKVFLDPAKVLNVEFKPTKQVDGVLDLKNSNTKIAMQFLDSPRPAPDQRPLLDVAGWNVRVRRMEGSDKIELSYKRRYKFEPGRLADALAAAAADGFDAREDDYEAQVEWGFKRETLSFTRKKEFEPRTHGDAGLPHVAEMIEVAVREMPGKLDRAKAPGWARGILAGSRLYGPVLGKRWAGDWQGPGLSFEVWMLRDDDGAGFEPVVELSFKAKTQPDAAAFREKLLEFVRDQGWLVERDVLKTAMILDRY